MTVVLLNHTGTEVRALQHY